MDWITLNELGRVYNLLHLPMKIYFIELPKDTSKLFIWAQDEILNSWIDYILLNDLGRFIKLLQVDIVILFADCKLLKNYETSVKHSQFSNFKLFK